MSNYKRKEVMDYLTRKPVTTEDIELARTRIQIPATPLPMQVASGEERVLNTQPFYQEPKELVQDDSPSPQVDSIPLYQGVQPGVAIQETMPIYLPPDMAPVMPQVPGLPNSQFRQVELAEGGRAEFKKGSDPYNLGSYIYIRELPNDEIRYRVAFEGKEKIFKNKDEAIKYRDNLVSEKNVLVQKELGNKKFINNEDFKKLFIEKKLSDKDFANFLNEQGYVTDKKGLFTDSAVNSRRSKNDISSFVQEQRIQNVSEEGILKRAGNLEAFSPSAGKVEKGELLRQYKAGEIPDLETLLNKVQQREGTSSRTQRAKEDPEFRKIMLDRQRKSMEKMRSTPEGLERLREIQRKYRAKVAIELGAPPPPKNNQERFWLDLYQTAFRAEKGGIDSNIKFADYAPEKYPSMNTVKETTLIDSKTGEKLTFKNIENFINTYKPGKMTYDEILNEYDKKVFFQKNQDLKDFFGEKMSSNYQRGLRYNPANIHHPFGRFNNPYNIQFTFFPENKKEASLKKVFDTEFNRAETLSDKKKIFKDYISKLGGLGIQSGFNQRLYGERPTLEEQMIREGFDVSKDPRAEQIKKLKFETIEPSLAARMSNQLGFGPSGMIDVGEEVIKDVKGVYGKYAPQIAKGALTGLQVLGTPLGVAAYEAVGPGGLRESIQEGRTTEDIATDPFTYASLPFANIASQAVSNPTLQKILSLGLPARAVGALTPIGLTAIGATTAYQGIKNLKEEIERRSLLTPEQRQQEDVDKEVERGRLAETGQFAIGGRVGYADGSDDPESDLYIPPLNKSEKTFKEGILNLAVGGRVGFKNGPEDPTKRKFIKGAGVVGALGVAAKYAPDLFTAAKKAVPKIAKVIENAPEWFSNFLSKVVNEKTFLFAGEQYKGGPKAKIHNYVDPVSGKKVGAVDNGDSIEFQFETDAGMPANITYIKPSTKIDPKTGEKIESAGLYEESELVYRGQGDDYTKDVYEEIISGREGIARIGAPGKTSKTDKARYDFDEAEGQAQAELDRIKDSGILDD